MMLDAHPEIREALVLIKHGSPEPDQVKLLTVALGLLINAIIAVAREHSLIEPCLAQTANLLHEHISGTCGLLPDNGNWKPYR